MASFITGSIARSERDVTNREEFGHGLMARRKVLYRSPGRGDRYTNTLACALAVDESYPGTKNFISIHLFLELHILTGLISASAVRI